MENFDSIHKFASLDLKIESLFPRYFHNQFQLEFIICHCLKRAREAFFFVCVSIYIFLAINSIAWKTVVHFSTNDITIKFDLAENCNSNLLEIWNISHRKCDSFILSHFKASSFYRWISWYMSFNVCTYFLYATTQFGCTIIIHRCIEDLIFANIRNSTIHENY